MNQVRSSLGGGLAATLALLVFLLVAGLFVGDTTLFVFTRFTGLCAVGGPPYCTVGTPLAAGLTLLVFLALFAVAWPLLFGGFTWGLPGESGAVHGAVFGVVLWTGYAVVVWIAIWRGWETFAQDVPVLVTMLLAYLVYGTVLGSGYDRLADHRTFLGDRPARTVDSGHPRNRT